MLKRYLSEYVSLLKLAFPLVLTQAGQMTVQLVDTAMVGRLGTPELAAASFANNIYIVVMLFGLGIFLGVTPLIGQALGANEESRVASIMKSGFVLSGALIPVVGILAWSVIWIMPHMGQREEIVRLAIPFYRLLVISVIPFLLFTLIKQIGEGLGNTLVAMVATVISNLINIVLNYVLIFGKFGFPQLGLRGSGYATLIARTCMVLLLYAGFMYIKPIRHYFNLMGLARSSFEGVKKIFSVGLPIAGQLVLEVSSFSFSIVMIGWLGAVSLASNQVVLGLASFTYMIANGVAMATTIRVSFQLGNRNFERMERVSYSAVHLVMTYMGCSAIAFILFRNQLPLIFTADPLVVYQASSLMLIAGLFQMFDGLQVVCLGVLRGLADVRAPMFIAGFSYMGIGLSVSYFCAFTLKLGAAGIWLGFLAGLVAAGILLSLRIRHRFHELHQCSLAHPPA